MAGPLTYKDASEIVTAARLELESKIERAKQEARDDLNGVGQRFNDHVRETDQRFAANETRLNVVAEQGAHTSGSERIVLMLLAALVSALMGLALKNVGTKTIIGPQPTVTATATVTATPTPGIRQSAPAAATAQQVIIRETPTSTPSPRPSASVSSSPSPTPSTKPGLVQRVCHLLGNPAVVCKGKSARRHIPPLLFPALFRRRR